MPSGGNASVTITPDSGYEIDQVYVNGVAQLAPNRSGWTLVLTNVHSNQSVTASFRALSCALTVSVSGGHGTITRFAECIGRDFPRLHNHSRRGLQDQLDHRQWRGCEV